MTLPTAVLVALSVIVPTPVPTAVPSLEKLEPQIQSMLKSWQGSRWMPITDGSCGEYWRAIVQGRVVYLGTQECKFSRDTYHDWRVNVYHPFCEPKAPCPISSIVGSYLDKKAQVVLAMFLREEDDNGMPHLYLGRTATSDSVFDGAGLASFTITLQDDNHQLVVNRTFSRPSARPVP